MQNERTSAYIKLFNFIGNVVNVNHSDCASYIVNYVYIIFNKIQCNRFKAVGLPCCVVQEVAAQVDVNNDEYLPGVRASEAILHNSPLLPSNTCWANVFFSCGLKKTSRTLKLLKWSQLSSGCLVFCSETLFNVKLSLRRNLFKLLPWRIPVLFKIEQLDDYCYPEATKLVVSILSSSLMSLGNEAGRRALEIFFLTPRIVSKGDVVTVELGNPCLAGLDVKTFRFVANDIEGHETCSNDSAAISLVETFVVTSCTSVYEVSSCQSFAPPSCLSTGNRGAWLSPIPPGMEDNCRTLLSWFYPFLFDAHQDLLPVFIIHGPSGVGKTLLLKLVSEYMGLSFQSVDSYDLVSNVQSHIAASVKGLSKMVASSAPCLVELFNSEVMCAESDAIDPDQMFTTLSKAFGAFETSYPVILVLSTTKLDSLSQNFLNLALRQLHIDKPAEEKKDALVSWIAVQNDVTYETGAIELLKAATSAFHFGDLERLICSSCDLQETLKLCSVKLLEQELRNMQLSKSSEVGTSTWQDIGGVEEIKREVLNSLLTSRLMPSLKRTGILLHGPPGTGKTLLARTVASQCNRSFISVKGPELLNMYIGQSEANIRQVFLRAKESAPCIMFFDELDSLAPNRGNKSDAGGVMDRVVSQLLAEVDSLENDDIFILGATNRPDLLDPALLRPGRFDKKVYVGPCEDETSKMKVLKALTRKFHMKTEVLDEVMNYLPSSVTGANVFSLCSTAWNLAASELIRSGDCGQEVEVKVDLRHFQEAANQLFNL